jgi:Amt family ammonium transporter
MLSSVNTIWVLWGSALVFFMQAGFAMVETGFTRAKNAGNIIMKNLMDFSIGAPLYWLIGFGIMFGSGNGFFGWIDPLTLGEYSLPDGVSLFAFRAHQIQLLLHLQRHHQPCDLSRLGPLDLGRRLAGFHGLP